MGDAEAAEVRGQGGECGCLDGLRHVQVGRSVDGDRSGTARREVGWTERALRSAGLRKVEKIGGTAADAIGVRPEVRK